MAKKNFSAGSTKSGVLNNDGGEKLREIQASGSLSLPCLLLHIVLG